MEVIDGENKFDIDVLRLTVGDYRAKLQALPATKQAVYIVLNLGRPDLLSARCDGDLGNVAKAICSQFHLSGLQVMAILPEHTGSAFKAKIKQLKRKANRTAAR